MSGQIDTFGAFVRAELEHWGREFALHRDCEYLGHQSKNMLQVLIEHRGEMPPPNVGYKPLETDQRAQDVEDAVASIARVEPVRGAVLRGYYCGMGRRGVERFEQANELILRLGHPKISRAKYFSEHELGFSEIRGFYWGVSRAA